MGIVADVLGEYLGQLVRGFEKHGRSTKRSVRSAQEVVERQRELGYDAWFQRECYAAHVTDQGVLAWHKGSRPATVRQVYREAAAYYDDLLQCYDFECPVARWMSVHWAGDEEIECQKKSLGNRFLEVREGENGKQLWFLEKTELDAYTSEPALLCAVISQDWDLAVGLAERHPQPLRVQRKRFDTFLLLRLTLLGDKRRAKQYAAKFPKRTTGIDFPPKRPDFALAIADGDEALLAKALKGTNDTFRAKWKVEKYITPKWLHRHGGSRERLMDAIRRDLVAHHWLYSPWAVAMMCIAGREGLTGLHEKPGKFSDFVPHTMCAERPT
ncbi:MAG TPA: hypothetical protein VMY37_26065 [Thermoguttaceae bacterium]|nr:hypothetical protein [Thermoguttaceae bacterium]